MVGVPDNKSRYIWRVLSMRAWLNCFREQKIERREDSNAVLPSFGVPFFPGLVFLGPLSYPARVFLLDIVIYRPEDRQRDR